MRTTLRWEQQGPKSWAARDHADVAGLVLHIGDEFLAFDDHNQPLGKGTTLESAQQLVITAAADAAHPRRGGLAAAVSTVAAFTVAAAALIILVRTFT
jgi:hypothetical protein